MATKTATTEIPLLKTRAAIMIDMPRPKNTCLATPQWDILTTSDTTTTSDNGRSTNIIPTISFKEQLRKVRLQKDFQFIEYQRLHLEKKRLEEKPYTYQILVS